MSVDLILSMPVITSRNVPDGQFFIIDRKIYTSLTLDQLMVKLWVGDALKAARINLARVVANAERRLGLAPR